MDAAQDHTVSAGAVVQHELQQLFALGHCGALLDLHSTEIGLGEGLKGHLIGKQRLDLYIGEINGLSGSGRCLGRGLGQCRGSISDILSST